MPAAANRSLRVVEVPPGADGVALVHGYLADALRGMGPAVALAPFDDGSLHVRRQYEALHPDEPLESDEVSVLVTTSGSTGSPLGVLLTADALMAAAAAAHAFTGGPGRWLVAMPVTAVGGLMTVVRALHAGIAPVAWHGTGGAAPFTPESFMDAAERTLAMSAADGAPTYVSLVPTQLNRLSASSEALDVLARFAHVLIGAAALPPALRSRAESAGATLTSTYGASETCGGVVYDGRPLDGVAVQIGVGDREGRVDIGGTTVAAGYRCRPDLTTDAFQAGWYRTADVGVITGGLLRVLGRGDDVVKVGGVKVALPALVAVATSVPGVTDAAAVAVDDDEWGQRPVLFVQGTAHDSAVLDALERSLGRTRTLLRRVGSLPYLPNGKIDRMELSAMLGDPQAEGR